MSITPREISVSSQEHLEASHQEEVDSLFDKIYLIVGGSDDYNLNLNLYQKLEERLLPIIRMIFPREGNKFM